MSSGEHYGCFEVRLDSGACRFLGDGALIGVSPTCHKVVIADANYEANYKEFRGGRRFGPLQVVDVNTRKTKAITTSPATDC